MPVLAFISGGNLFNTGEWMVLPFGSALLVLGLIVIADYLPRFIILLSALGILSVIALGIWFGITRWWDIGGIAKACLVGMHAITGFSLLLRALTRQIKSRRELFQPPKI